jgi:uncharacterized protein (UPF0305 family)
MTSKKRQALQKILEALIPHREMAKWFLLLLQEWWNEKLIEQLYKNIINEIKQIKSKSQQKKIKKALKNLKEKSDRTTKEDEEWAEQLLNNFIDNIE